jgi:hypothetical protein
VKGGIRPYAPADVAQVLRLHGQTLWTQSPAVAAWADYLKSLYGDVLFDHPWYDDDLPSLVYERDDGKIVGFLGVVPRPMMFDSRRIRAAVSVRLMVDPESPHGALAAAALHRRYLHGPQDLSLVENANFAARRVWAGTPGVVIVPLGCISWSVTRTAGRAPKATSTDRTIDGDELLHCIEHSAELYALRPAYDHDSLGWLLEFLESAHYRGTLHLRAVDDRRGQLRGWYIYYSNPSGYNGVLALRSAPGEAGRTLRSLLDHAHRSGGAARTAGRLQADLVCAVADEGCGLTPGPWTFAYSSDPRISRALAAGDGFLTRLDGEFC